VATIQHDDLRTRRAYLEVVGLIAMLAFPTMLGLLVVAEPFVVVVFGEQWREVAALLPVLCAVGVLQAVANPTSSERPSTASSPRRSVTGS